MIVVDSWNLEDLEALEKSTGLQSFALDPAWAEAAQASGYARPRWLGVREHEPIQAVALGLHRVRAGFSKIVCGSNGGVGILARDADAASAILVSMRRRWKPSVLEVFTSGNHPASFLSWEGAFTVQIDLRQSLHDLRSGLEKKTRNAISKAQRSGLKTHLSAGSEVTEALDLLEATARRRKFVLPPRNYLAALHDRFRRSGMSEFVAVRRDGELLAIVHVLGARGVASWWKGGASEEGYRLNAPALAQWHAIEESKARGFGLYDMGGTHPTDPSYAGIHQFKTSFGGRLVTGALGRYATFAARTARRLFPS